MSKATTVKRFFSRETKIRSDIAEPVERVWAVLTNAAEFPRWNSTIVSLKGDIQPGEKLELVSTLAPKRTFKLKIKEFDAPQHLVWGDAMGSRIFSLEKTNAGTRFSMTEKIGGPLFPLFARMIPPFDESFEQFVVDLTAEAAKNQP